ncbi:hypothetical protein CEXT_154871 [Caerostris extrusa]|uniref:Uncharacterized protein n=1 Tax=Caerostris extrusa TaxID=172846 RepID=A0AAV4Y0A3_CAEEX|nr:hypothetical protein CEXT_154871 [Caerostris extrusa]
MKRRRLFKGLPLPTANACRLEDTATTYHSRRRGEEVVAATWRALDGQFINKNSRNFDESCNLVENQESGGSRVAVTEKEREGEETLWTTQVAQPKTGSDWLETAFRPSVRRRIAILFVSFFEEHKQ